MPSLTAAKVEDFGDFTKTGSPASGQSPTASELGNLDFTRASDAYERALALAPGNAEALRLSGRFTALMGHFDAGLAATRRAVVLDPLARASHSALGRALDAARRYEEAVAAFAEVISLEPDHKDTYAERGLGRDIA